MDTDKEKTLQEKEISLSEIYTVKIIFEPVNKNKNERSMIYKEILFHV